MKALVFDEKLRFRTDYPAPGRRAGEALIKVLLAGVCNTDLEILKGYMGFKGVPGHEFVGEVVESSSSNLVGKRVAGEINLSCGRCSLCESGMGTHCPARSVLGIMNKDGAFAEYLTLPEKNLHILPPNVNNRDAVFVEPLAAAFEILEQVRVGKDDRVIVLGDGKLGLLIAMLLHTTGCRLVAAGHHEEKLSILQKSGIETCLEKELDEKGFDVAVEATGSSGGLKRAMELVRPRGSVVLKSTVAEPHSLDLSPLVINEVNLIGSRCGPFRPAIDLLNEKKIDLSPMITGTFPLEKGVEALEYVKRKGVLKVIIDMRKSGTLDNRK